MEVSIQGFILPLIAGVITGALIRMAIRAATLLIILLVILMGMGALSASFGEVFNSLKGMWDAFKTILGVSSLVSALPLTAPSFLVGVVIGYFLAKY